MRRWKAIPTLGLLSIAGVALASSGCLATRNWVNEQLEPMSGRMGAFGQRLDSVDSKADRALAGLENLHLEQKLVVGMKDGARFKFNSASLSPQARGEIDRFMKELAESSSVGATAPERVFVIAGHADSTGKPDYNYELAQRRAERVAGYLVSEKGIDPMHVRVVSYGASKPLAENRSESGRRQNRRIEIMVYREAVASGPH